MVTITSLEKQIKALNDALRKAINGETPNANIFALNNKIKRKTKELQELKQYEFLSR